MHQLRRHPRTLVDQLLTHSMEADLVEVLTMFRRDRPACNKSRVSSGEQPAERIPVGLDKTPAA